MPRVIVVVVGLAQVAVNALVAYARMIGIWRRGGVKVFASRFGREFGSCQGAVGPAAREKTILFQVVVRTDVVNSDLEILGRV